MNSTIILSIIGFIIYGIVFCGPAIIDKKINQARGLSGAKLRAGILHLILRYGALCTSQLSILLDKRMNDIEDEIQILIKRGIIKELEREKVKPQGFADSIYSFRY